MMMMLSANGQAMIAGFEGLRHRVYNDDPPNGNATIGIGHLLHRGPPTLTDQLLWWSTAKCYTVLRQDAATAVAAVNRLVTRPLGQGQFDALVSFTFNVGEGAFAGSSLLRLVNKQLGPVGAVQIEAAFLAWDHDGGVVLAGLYRRRQAEANLFLQGVYP